MDLALALIHFHDCRLLENRLGQVQEFHREAEDEEMIQVGRSWVRIPAVVNNVAHEIFVSLNGTKHFKV